MTISGLAADAVVAEDVRRAMKEMPSSFKSTETLRVKEIPLKTVEPFTTSISASGGVMTFQRLCSVPGR